ncbi:MAG: YadA C-terminal domain-containing protein, partial [Plesiomonas shigelloides]
SEINNNFSQVEGAIHSNNNEINQHSADISAAGDRLDKQAQFDQVVGITLEANRQQAAAHNTAITNNTENLSQAGAAIQQNHDAIAGHSDDISAAGGRLDKQAQFDQVVGATLEANRQQAVVHSISIANNTDNLVQAGTAIQQNSKRIDSLQEWKEISDSRIQRLESNITNNRTVSSKGIAGVAAMTNIPTPTDGSLSFGIGYGYYDSYDALAIGASKYFESGIALKASVSLTSGKSVAGLGASYSFN